MSSFALSLLLTAAAVTPITHAGPPAGVFDPPPIVRHQLEEGASKQAAYEEFLRGRGDDVKNWAAELPPPRYDVVAYDLDLFVDPTRRVLSGSVTVTLAAVVDGLTEVLLDADLGLRILSARGGLGTHSRVVRWWVPYRPTLPRAVQIVQGRHGGIGGLNQKLVTGDLSSE